MKKEELEKKIFIVKQAVMELRENPNLIKKMEKPKLCYRFVKENMQFEEGERK
jgi:hypothetical protein